MKKIKSLLFLIVVSTVITAWAQTEKPDKDLSKEHDAEWYAHQAALWEKEVKNNPNDDDAWYYWFLTTRNKSVLEQPRHANIDDMSNALIPIINKLHKERPDSYARYIIDYINYTWFSNMPNSGNKEAIHDNMLKAIKMRPDFKEMYTVYVTFLMRKGRTDLMADIIERWYKDGTYSYILLSFAYNCLAGMEENGILFVTRQEEALACLMVQYGKGLFQDRLIINLDLLQETDYLEYVCRLLGVEAIQPPADKNNSDYMNIWRENQIFSIAHNTKRPVYFTSIYKPEFFQESLYSEGFVLKYSTKRYDNLAVKRRNYESVYLTDYLYETFVPESLGQSAYYVNLNFIPCFKSLLDYYKAQGMTTEYNGLRTLMTRIVETCVRLFASDRREYIMERYYNEIDR